MEALSRILAGFPLEKLHVASFDTMGMHHVPKAANRTAVAHMLSGVSAGGGTMHTAAVHALSAAGVKVPETSKLIVFVVGDEAGEQGARFAQSFADEGYRVDAMALILNVAYGRGRAVTAVTADCARASRPCGQPLVRA